MSEKWKQRELPTWVQVPRGHPKDDAGPWLDWAVQVMHGVGGLLQEIDNLKGYVEWIVSLEDSEERRTVTLTKIIDRARQTLNTPPREE